MPITGYQSIAFLFLMVLEQFEVSLPPARCGTSRFTLDLERLRARGRMGPLSTFLDEAFGSFDALETHADPERCADLYRVLQVLAEHRRISTAREALQMHAVLPIHSWMSKHGDEYMSGRLGGRLGTQASGNPEQPLPAYSPLRLRLQEEILDCFVRIYHGEVPDGLEDDYEILDQEEVLRMLVRTKLEDPADAIDMIEDGGYMEEFFEGEECVVELDEELLCEIVEELYEDLHPWEMLERIVDWNLVEVCLAKGLIRPHAPKLPLRNDPSIGSPETER